MLTRDHLRGASPDHASGSYRAWSLSGIGCALVDLAWRSRVEIGRPETHRLLPHAEPSLAIRRRFDAAGATSSYRIEITSISPDGDTYCPEPGEEMFALRLCPELLESGLGLKAAELHGEGCAVPHALSPHLEDVRRLADGDRFEDAWAALLGALSHRSQEADRDRFAHAVNLSRRTGGRLSPAELAERAGISPRHLRRGYVDRFGLSPRGWARRLRLTAAMLEAERSDRPDWAGIAAGHRFSDQAHMIRECRAILGRSPSQIHAERRPMAVSFNISD